MYLVQDGITWRIFVKAITKKKIHWDLHKQAIPYPTERKRTLMKGLHHEVIRLKFYTSVSLKIRIQNERNTAKNLNTCAIFFLGRRLYRSAEFFFNFKSCKLSQRCVCVCVCVCGCVCVCVCVCARAKILSFLLRCNVFILVSLMAPPSEKRFLFWRDIFLFSKPVSLLFCAAICVDLKIFFTSYRRAFCLFLQFTTATRHYLLRSRYTTFRNSKYGYVW